ncbi:hypothetical protein A5893_15430 [Pedobacter psychrophilus]|uniref:Uncharacterized protein n=1 Tax=Pedobacter psychrophilus TaxID=1826909 RepID=A0A179DB14_9SPHI|nr:hypothetical protein A5893_15430 [Pedobacter psychrophilus]
MRIKDSKILKRIFSDKLLEHINNCLDHIKMFPIYMEMGFEEEKFLLDFYEDKCTSKEISNLKNLYKIGRRFNSQAVDFYIGKFFAIKADPNKNFNYENCLKTLNQLDSKLFSILTDFVCEWQEFNIELKDPMCSYRDIVNKFYENLKAWMTKKEFT